MTAAPAGASKAAAENTDAVENSKTDTAKTENPEVKDNKNTDEAVKKPRARKAAGSTNENEVLPKADPEALSKPGDETRREVEDDNATPSGVERDESDPAKHPVETKPQDAQRPEDRDTDSHDNTDPDNVPDEFDNPLGLTGDSDGKSDQLKDRNIEDLEKDTPSVAELPENVPAPNAVVPDGEVEFTRNAKKGELSDPGGKVTERSKVGRARAPKKDALKEFTDYSQLPIAAAVGQVTATVEEHAGRPVFKLSLRGWVGDAPFQILAADVGELEQVIAELRGQLKE